MKKQTDKIKRVAIIANTEKVAGASLVRKAAKLLAKNGIEVLTNGATARMARFKAPILADVPELARAADLILVFGGDGTVLSLTRDMAGSELPCLPLISEVSVF